MFPCSIEDFTIYIIFIIFIIPVRSQFFHDFSQLFSTLNLFMGEFYHCRNLGIYEEKGTTKEIFFIIIK
jgi:hypothetical protein